MQIFSNLTKTLSNDAPGLLD